MPPHTIHAAPGEAEGIWESNRAAPKPGKCKSPLKVAYTGSIMSSAPTDMDPQIHPAHAAMG